MRQVPPLKPMPDGKRFSLVTEMSVADWGVRVPAGFITDLASVPWFARSIVPRWGRFGAAAIVHDWYYKDQHVERDYADLVFYQMMAEDGVWWWRRQVIYAAVRLFGWAAWNSNGR